MSETTPLNLDPQIVIKILNDADVHYVLMGTHGINGWRSSARATADVDFLIVRKDHAKAVRALKKKHPELRVQDNVVVTRFVDPTTDEPTVDFMKPNFEILKRVFRNSVWVGDSHRVPNLEMALASKFAAMVSPNRRRSKKIIDAGDFADMVEKNQKVLDREKLKVLGRLVYPSGAKEILELVDSILTGKKIII